MFKKATQCRLLKPLVSRYSQVTQGLFGMGKQQKVDVNYLASLMAPKFSPEGSSQRLKEEITDNFQDFLNSLEYEVIKGYTEAIAYNTDDDYPDQCTNNDQEIETFSIQDLPPAWSTSFTVWTETS